MKKMAFVDLTNFKDWPLGGMLEYELAILKHLVKKYDVDIWGVSVDGVIEKTLEIDGKKYPIHVYGNVKTRKKVIPNYWRGMELYTQKQFFSKDYDVIYAHTGSCLMAAGQRIDRKKTKLVYHQHGLNHRVDFSLMSLVQRPGLWGAQKMADLVFVVSDADSVEKYAKEMEHKTKARFVSIGSPVDLSRFDENEIREKIRENKKQKARNFLYTGRLSAFKNVKTLIDAINLYKQNEDPDVKLVVAGVGGEFDSLNRQIHNLQLEQNVKLVGAVPHDDIYELLRCADVFLTASGGEGVSVSVIEAYAAGLPVVCFNVPGLERQVIDGVTGIIAKEKTLESFYDAMIRLNKNRNQMALNCLEEVKRYEAEGIAAKISEEIDSLF